jgi:hypothetical protein
MPEEAPDERGDLVLADIQHYQAIGPMENQARICLVSAPAKAYSFEWSWNA